MKIKVLEKTEGCMPVIFKQGDWIDLRLAEDVTLHCPKACKLHRRKDKGKEINMEERTRDVIFESCIANLGICMQLPEGYEAPVIPRSSSFKKYGILQTNSYGLIDCSYCGDEDEWKMPMVATRTVTIPKGTRIAQFRIQLSQKATVWQKIKWLLSSPKISFIKVDSLGNKNRRGLGEGTAEK